MDRDALIRQRAYQLWEKSGRPDGKAEEHWEEARRQIDAEQASSKPGKEAGSGSRRSRTRKVPKSVLDQGSMPEREQTDRRSSEFDGGTR